MPRRLILLFVVALIASGRVAPCRAEPPAESRNGACTGVATAGAEVEAVRQMELRGARMNVDGWDIEDARTFFAPDFVGIGPGGAISDLAAVTSNLTNGRSPGWARSFDLPTLDIRVYNCEFAIVIGTAEARALAQPADAPAQQIRFLNIWRMEGGRWQYWANQFTSIAKSSAGEAQSPRP